MRLHALERKMLDRAWRNLNRRGVLVSDYLRPPRRRGRRRPTVCPAGHPYSGENLYIDPRGCARCRACNRDRYHALKRLGHRGA